MRHPRLLIGLLLLATVLVDLVVVSMLPGFAQSRTDIANFGLSVLAISQTALAAIWVGHGGKWMPWTTLLLVLSVFGFAMLFDLFFGPGCSPYAVTLLSLQSIVIVISLGLARGAGVRLILTGDVDREIKGGSGRQRFQFSVGYLFSWLTAVAVALGIGSYSVRYAELASVFTQFEHAEAATVLGMVMLPLAALWTLLGTQRMVLRLVTLFVVLGGVAWLWIDLATIPVWESTIILWGQALWLAGSLAVVRVAGYRLVRSSTRS